MTQSSLVHLSTLCACLAAASGGAQDARVSLYGNALPGTQGVPVLLSDALPEIGALSNLRVHNGRPGASNVMFLGLHAASLPVLGLEILVDPILAPLVMPPLDPLGATELAIPIAPAPGLIGLTLAFQDFIIDPGAPGPLGIAHTGGLLWEFGAPGMLPPPVVFNVTPQSGAEGTVITILGQGFDPNPDNNCVFLGDFDARAMVFSATPNQLVAVIGPVSAPSTSGDITVARGSGVRLPLQPADLLGALTAADPAALLVADVATTDAGFRLGPLSNAVRSQTVGAGAISFQPQANWSGDFKIDIYVRNAAGRLTKDIHIPVQATPMTFAQCVAHIRAHLLAVLPNVTVTGSAANGTIVVSDPSFGSQTTGTIS